MYTIQTRNSISPKGLERLPSSLFVLQEEADEAAGILVRSASLHEEPLPDTLLAIARAGAGTNNIPVEACTEKGVVVFNTPGANANAVKELVMGGLVLASRNVAGGIEWAKTLAEAAGEVPALVEKGKGRFTGPELEGKKLGVIGLGAIGVRVANMATHLGMEVLGYDPYISIDAAWSLSRSVVHCVNLSEVITQADYLTLHLPVNKDTKHFVGAEVLAQMKPGVRILNFARADLVDNNALLPALKAGRVAAYVTDFPTADLIGQPGVVCIPHLGASTPESEENCAVMAADELRDYLLEGNITNSVNLPSVAMPRSGAARLCVIHRNMPGMLAGITAALNTSGLNIENLTNKGRGDYAYTMVDLSAGPGPQLLDALRQMDGFVRVRVV